MTGLLTDSDLASMRAVATSSLPDLCTIRRATLTSDGVGGQTQAWATLTADVACALGPYRHGQDHLLAARAASRQVWNLTLPYGTDVTGKDEVTIGARTFEVIALQAPRSYEITRELTLAETAV